jgi:hypothetical protein
VGTREGTVRESQIVIGKADRFGKSDRARDVDYTLICPYAGVPLYTHYTQHSTIYIYDHVIICTVWIYIRVSSNENREKKRRNLTHE